MMSVNFKSSVFLLILLQLLLLNFAFVQSRVLETKDSNAYYTKWKVNSTNLYLDTAIAVDTNRTEIPSARTHEDSYLMLSRSSINKKVQENQFPHPTLEVEMGYWNVSESQSKVDRTQNNGLFSNITEEGNIPSTGKSMDTSQKSYRTVNAALRNGDSWPWGKSERKRTHNEDNEEEDNNNVSTRMRMGHEDHVANSAHFICKDHIPRLTVLLSLFITIFYFQCTNK